ncbi:MAG: 16S rRNA (cytidine(1402)-2'-O)-methyltransferase [Ruminococcaceae bacterium]|nr:16S rRNA (cytidine(1402)-2'-O)-methyltransferase [Oscillospiraceae bacterium]
MKEPNFEEKFEEKNKIESGTLYLVATPIGNLADISYRALKILEGVDFIAAEDTRNSLKLLTYFGISKPLVSYFEHNKKERGPQIIKRLSDGESCALITDAGTPAISDPGEDLVRLCAENGVKVTSVPGACAAITALTLSGLDTRRFVFEGFVSGTKSEVDAHLTTLKNEKRTMIFYEAPHRLSETLEVFYLHFGDRKTALCREITKLNEEVKRTTLAEAVAFYKENAPRGEYVIVIEGATDDGECFWKDMSVQEQVDYYISLGMAKMDAIKETARARGVGKSAIYKELIN